MKKIYLTALSFILTTAAFAQLSVNVAYQFGIPASGYSGDMGNSVLGANVKISKYLDDYLSLNIGGGYYMVPFNTLNIDNVNREVSDVNLTIIPVTAGATFHLLGTKQDKTPSKIKPFIGIDLGAALTSQSAANHKSHNMEAVNRTNFIIAPSFGIAYELTDNIDFFGSVRNNMLIYSFADKPNTYSTFQLIGINVGLNFKF